RRTPPFPHGAPQSTIPPPPEEEVPIPLVRRMIPQPFAPAEGIENDDEPVLPLSHTKPVSRRPPRPTRAARPPVLREPAKDAPRASCRSSRPPPPPGEDEESAAVTVPRPRTKRSTLPPEPGPTERRADAAAKARAKSRGQDLVDTRPDHTRKHVTERVGP